MANSTMQNNPAAAPAPSGGSVDHGSSLSLTDASSLEDENYIALLQYRDARHILNLQSPSSDSAPPSPDAVQKAYDNAREEAQLALEQFEAKHRLQAINNTGQSRRNTVFFVSQLNYLELKLQALDQAYEELMPSREDAEGSVLVGEGLTTSCAAENDDANDDDDGRRSREKTTRGAVAREATVEDEPFDGALEVLEGDYPPTSVGPRREFVWGGDDVDVAKADTVVKVGQRPQHQRRQEQQPHGPEQRQQQQSQEQHKRESNDDDIVAIDIYFRPSQTKSREEKPRAKSPTCDSHPSDVSSCTWDGSSIFSMISGPKNGAIDAASGLSDFLGLRVTTSGDDRDDGKERRVDVPHNKTRRPPLGIDVRRARKKGPSVSSPTSVSDFPGHARDDDPHHGRIAEKSRSVEAGRGRTTAGSSRHHARASASPHDSVEAARMGILRALSEENSVCLPMEDDEHERYGNDRLNVSNASSGLSDEALFNKRPLRNFGGQRVRKGELSSKCFFQGKSDQMPKDSNSLMSSVIEGRVDHRDRAPGPQPRSCTADAADGSSTRDRISSPRSLVSSTSTVKGQRTNSNSSASSPSMNSNTSHSNAKLEPRDDRFGDILQVGMELADELCTALNNCWSGLDLVGGTPSEMSDRRHRRIDRSSQHNEEESTLCTKSTYTEDQSFFTRSVGTTDGGSTAFNTESSFSTESQKYKRENRRRVPMRNSSNTRPFRQKMDPPVQRMV